MYHIDEIEDFEMSFDGLFFKLSNGNHKMIEHNHQDEITMEHAVDNWIEPFYYDKVFYQNIKNKGNFS